MKLQAILILFCILFLILNKKSIAQTPSWSWAERGGGIGQDGGVEITTDNFKNSYIVGNFYNTAYFGNLTIQSYGSKDIFIAKYDSLGNIIWLKGIGSSEFDIVADISTIENGQFYIAGSVQDTAHFENDTLFSDIDEMIFIAKYDTSGNKIWVKKIGITPTGICAGITRNSLGGIYLAGNFTDTAVFQTDTFTSFGTYDIFLAKYDSLGNELWVSRAGGINSDQSLAISVDNTDNLRVTGQFENTINFDGLSLWGDSINPDMFIASYDSTGQVMWANWAGGKEVAYGTAIATDVIGNSYVTGIFSDTAHFGNLNIVSFSSANIKEIFLAKYDVNGNIIWAQNAGGLGEDYAYALTVDSECNFYITGGFYDIATFDTITVIGSSPLGPELYVAKYDSSGNVNWVKTSNGSCGSGGYGISVRNNDEVWITGTFGHLSCNAIFETDTLLSMGNADIFISKIGTNIGTGIYSHEISLSINNYPNPFHNSLTFDINSGNSHELYIYDLISKNIYSQKFKQRLIIDTSDFRSGMYFYTIIENNKIIDKGKVIRN